MNAQRFTRPVIEDPENPGELLLDLGEEICKLAGLEPGDVVEWKDNKDGTWTIMKKTSTP